MSTTVPTLAEAALAAAQADVATVLAQADYMAAVGHVDTLRKPGSEAILSRPHVVKLRNEATHAYLLEMDARKALAQAVQREARRRRLGEAA
jgi:hypothetical protein